MLPRNHPDRIQITFDDRRSGCGYATAPQLTNPVFAGWPRLNLNQLNQSGIPRTGC